MKCGNFRLIACSYHGGVPRSRYQATDDSIRIRLNNAAGLSPRFGGAAPALGRMASASGGKEEQPEALPLSILIGFLVRPRSIRVCSLGKGERRSGPWPLGRWMDEHRHCACNIQHLQGPRRPLNSGADWWGVSARHSQALMNDTLGCICARQGPWQAEESRTMFFRQAHESESSGSNTP